MTTQTITEMTTEQIQIELNRRKAIELAEAQKRAQERHRLAEEAAEVGKREALVRVEEIKREMDKLVVEMDLLARKHFLYVEWEIAEGAIEFSRYGMTGTGWDSSSC